MLFSSKISLKTNVTNIYRESGIFSNKWSTFKILQTSSHSLPGLGIQRRPATMLQILPPETEHKTNQHLTQLQSPTLRNQLHLNSHRLPVRERPSQPTRPMHQDHSRNCGRDHNSTSGKLTLSPQQKDPDHFLSVRADPYCPGSLESLWNFQEVRLH